jgi:L-amino acid N-acyltransferase YncA
MSAMSSIRLAQESDAPGVCSIYAPIVRDTVISFETVVPNDDTMVARIRDTLTERPWIVCEDEGEIQGYAYAGPHRSRSAYMWSAEVSVYVAESARRLGTARRLYGALFALLQRQGYRNAYAGITLPNDASVGLHESLGFREVGVYRGVGFKFDAWLDVGWWALRLDEKAESADPLRDIAGVLNGFEWRDF